MVFIVSTYVFHHNIFIISTIIVAGNCLLASVYIGKHETGPAVADPVFALAAFAAAYMFVERDVFRN